MSLKYRPEIDGLRAVAVLPVILFHAGFDFFSGGYVGVDIFFVISGYLIGYIILEKCAAGEFSIIEFYENRARRILPALFVVMLACIPAAWIWADLEQWDEFSDSLTWVALFASNIFFWGESGYFSEAAELKPLLHTWSLAIEEQFYLVFPLMAVAFFKLGTRWLWILLSLIIIASLGFCIWFYDQDPSGSFFFSPTRFWELLIGVLCALAIIKRTKSGRVKRLDIANIGSFIGFILIIYAIIGLDVRTPFPSEWTLIPVIGTALVIMFAVPGTFIARLLSIKLLVWIGLVSYSAYLWHQPLFAFARMRQINEPSIAIMMALALVSLLLAFITWKFIEQPFRKKGGSGKIVGDRKILIRRGPLFASALAGILVFSVLGQFQAKELIQPNRFANVNKVTFALKKAGQDRLKAIRMGTCDFFPTVGWQGKWDCAAGTGADHYLKPIGIAIVGDSHANDKAMMLRRVGLSPTSFASSGCPLTPNTINARWGSEDEQKAQLLSKACLDLAEFGKAHITANDDITEIWLSNRFSEGALEIEALAAAIEFWSIPGKKLVFLNHTPEFPNMKRLLRKLSNEDELPVIKVDLKLNSKSSTPEVRALLAQNNISFIDVKALLCGNELACDYKNSRGQLLYTDGAHMSVVGAELAGERLLDMVDCSDMSPAIAQHNRDRKFC